MRQADALAILKTGVNVFLTGEPGSGKSHTIRQYVSYLREHGIEPAITASTGIAATHIGGMTIHSFSGIGINKTLNKYELAEIASRDKLVRRLKKTKVLIIDEISMLDGRTLSLVDLVCKTVLGSDQPFGGIQVVMVGDFFQLPPVGRDGDVPSFAFDSQVWRASAFTTCYLSEQHRQEDKSFLKMLAAVRSGEVGDEHRELLFQRKTSSAAQMTKLFSHNADVDRINAHELGKLSTKESVFTMRHHGAKALVEQIKRGCLSPERLVLKVGAKVMFTKNNPEQGFVNGTLGEVIAFQKGTGLPEVKLHSGRSIIVEPVDWAIVIEGTPLASIVQLPLRLAWAITVHKSQGMSLDAAYIDLSTAFAYGQGYVALSRVRSLAGLFIGGINERALEVDPTVLEIDSEFRASSDANEARLGEMSQEDLARAHSAFVSSCGGEVAGNVVYKPVKKVAQGKKGPVHEETIALLCSGKTITEVAQERGRTEGTILDHLEKARKQNKLPVDQLQHLKIGKDFMDVHLAFAVLGDEALKPAYARLDGRYTYDELRLARLFFVAP
ncbi:MAG: AAA ATPase [Candidatus Uhrbacteria bacterium GW2011_GWD2_52_7]|uniref:AAA ATPase n=1 Tax=Candidatus Uhrbacteria bacterium GW2011_GWD2_52_7 TaxID=1618989 RepID=A0A0G1XII8_9BACT|nr:MAG: AAA ATPase [Candidatus Uhrbacteria bacterium GW2011_GWD2_52_7]